jgi:hypothetical protein
MAPPNRAFGAREFNLSHDAGPQRVIVSIAGAKDVQEAIEEISAGTRMVRFRAASPLPPDPAKVPSHLRTLVIVYLPTGGV